ncbi:MAG: hypothetical protein WD749_12360 [Phycisphaerales bacterium]
MSFMTWIKSNTTIVASVGVIAVALPAAWFGSRWWNTHIRTAREQAVMKDSQALDALRVTFSLNPPFPGDEGVSLPMDAPNIPVARFLKGAKATLDAQVGEVVKLAEQINRADHKPLIDRLFPNPADRLLTLAFIEKLVGKPGLPSAYEDLLKKINAGGPADASSIADLLTEDRTQQVERKRAETGNDKMTPEEEAELTKRLAAIRIAEYQRHARSIAVYATTDAFPQAPRSIPGEPPDIATCFTQQFDYWVIADLLNAIDAANRPDRKSGRVETSIVKRIERIVVEPYAPAGAGQQPSMGAQPGQGPSFGPSLSGRTGGGPDAAYDLRNAEMTLIVESARLPDLLNTLSRTNFTTVTDLDIWETDPWADLEQGYFYGTKHVVRAVIKVETVWLRSWLLTYMPDAMKEQLKPAEAPPEAPPPPPPPRAVAPDEDRPKAKGPPQKRRPGSKLDG